MQMEKKGGGQVHSNFMLKGWHVESFLPLVQKPNGSSRLCKGAFCGVGLKRQPNPFSFLSRSQEETCCFPAIVPGPADSPPRPLASRGTAGQLRSTPLGAMRPLSTDRCTHLAPTSQRAGLSTRSLGVPGAINGTEV